MGNTQHLLNNYDQESCFNKTDWQQDLPWCGDCWRSHATNTTCRVLFWVYVTIFLVALTLTIRYIQLGNCRKRKSFNFIFVFVLVWVFLLCVMYLEAFFDYYWKPQIWFNSGPVIMTFIVIATVIDNL
jgi:hypothetical protein